MKTKKFNKILIANRGEIAVRVMRACREMGIAAVAVYSEADRQSPHVLAADQAVEIGPAPPLESYLNIARIIEAAKKLNCDAIHPGYGFLAENADFAQECMDAGITFIGPSPAAMKKVGDKLTARQTMIDAGIPVTPGLEIHDEPVKTVAEGAASIGFPVMVKATAGGGGKGMRIVHTAADLPGAIAASRREAQSAFGNDRVYLEKFIENPRHIEFQVLADHHGNIVHLFERECSIQRRHQKIIEESPSPVMDEKLRQKMGETACRVMEAVKYTNAGTVEFLLDADKNFYFLEVNARIQVEHPVTELVAGVDLVKQQIRIAAGEELPFLQTDLQQRGHAIECRVYAEDPRNNFLPSIGRLHFVKEPDGPGIRVDSGIYSGLEITHFYDPILSKLIVLGENRADAIQKMTAALNNYTVLGVITNIPFLKDVISHPGFAGGDFDTGFVKTHFDEWTPANHRFLEAALLIAALKSGHSGQKKRSNGAKNAETPWQILGNWELFS